MNNLYRSIKVAVIIVVSICIVTILIQVLLQGILNWDIIKEQLLYNAYYGLPLSLTVSWFFEFLDRKISWDENPKLRAILGVLGTITVTMLMLVLLNFVLWTLIEGKPISTLWLKSNRLFYIIGLILSTIVTSIIHAIGFFNEVQKEKKLSYELRQQKLSSELNALRAHIDPHFLFNSFNVLSGLIDEDKERAQTFLSGMSKIYRYILEQRNEDECSVREEIEFAEKYLDLHRMRFENGIKLNLDISEHHQSAKVPSLSLQLLLENAIKHNGFDADNPLLIEISSDEEFLLVKNSRSTRKELVVSSGVGLQNIKDRYGILSDKVIEIESTENEFIVKLPYL